MKRAKKKDKTVYNKSTHIKLTEELRTGLYFSQGPTWGTPYLYRVKEMVSPGKRYFLILVVKVRYMRELDDSGNFVYQDSLRDTRKALSWLHEKGKDRTNWEWHHQWSTFKHIQTYKHQRFYEFSTLSSLLSLL